MDDVSAGKDARIMTTLEIDLDSTDPALVQALAELKPLLRKILKIVRESPAENPEGSGSGQLEDGGFSKVAEPCEPSFHKVVKPRLGAFTKVLFTETRSLE